MIHAIVAMSIDGLIGVGDKLPWHLPNDLKRFKSITAGGAVVMGHNTYHSLMPYFPDGEVLPNRKKYVLTRNPNIDIDDDTVQLVMPGNDHHRWLRAMDHALGDVYIIGGAKVFEMFNNMYDLIHLTRVEHEFETHPKNVYCTLDLTEYILTTSEWYDADAKHAYSYLFEVWKKFQD